VLLLNVFHHADIAVLLPLSRFHSRAAAVHVVVVVPVWEWAAKIQNDQNESKLWKRSNRSKTIKRIKTIKNDQNDQKRNSRHSLKIGRI